MAHESRILTHPLRERIDKALCRRVPVSQVAREFKIPYSSLLSYRNEFLFPTIALATKADDEYTRERALEEMTGWVRDTLDEAIHLARKKKDPKALIAAVGQAHKHVELTAEIAGVLDKDRSGQQSNSVHVTLNNLIALPKAPGTPLRDESVLTTIEGEIIPAIEGPEGEGQEGGEPKSLLPPAWEGPALEGQG